MSAWLAAVIVVTAGSTTAGRSAAPQRSAVACMGGSISIPDMGTGLPYPSTCDVSGLEGTIADVNLDLTGLSHTYPDDMDMLLVSPSGQDAEVMSDAGGSIAAVDLDVTLDDDAIPSTAGRRTGPGSYTSSTTRLRTRASSKAGR